MGRIMISRKFKIILSAIFMFSLAQHSAAAQSSGELPTLYYVGIIPVQWEKKADWKNLIDARKVIDANFAKAVRASQRFSFLNDDLVKSLWATANGRKELEDDYEVSSYISLDMATRGDMAVMTVRLLSPKLQTQLQESDVLAKSALKSGTADSISSRMSDLVQRMLNRLPIDAHITSVNGGYVTLSGGSTQGIKNGQKFDVLAANISSFHPVTGGWLSFATNRTGSIEVVEVKAQSSIARISSLTKENSIKAGQGIRIDEIAGRARFTAAEAKPLTPSKALESAAANSASKVETVPTAPTTPQPPVTETAPKTPIAAENEPKDTPVKSVEATPPTDQNTSKDSGKNQTPEGAPETDKFTARIMPKGSEMRTWAGVRMWSISGSASANASLPAWLVNSVSGSIYRDFSDTIDYNYGVDFGYGPTGDGSFFSYNLHGAGRWHMYMKDVLPGADDVNFGLMANLTSANITGETSGGFDLTMIRLTLGVHGWAKPDFIGQKIEWTGEVFYPLYYSGQFGVKGKFREIVSGSSMAYRIGMYIGDRPAQGWQYGAAFDLEQNSWSLKTGKTAEQSSIGLLVLARRDI